MVSTPRKYPAMEEKSTLTDNLTFVISAKFLKNETFSGFVLVTVNFLILSAANIEHLSYLYNRNIRFLLIILFFFRYFELLN